jgi:hypothetical protein
MALIADIADAVVAELNAGSFSVPLTAERLYRPDFELPDMKDLHVSVVPHGLEMSTAGRALCQHDVQIDLAVQKKLDAADNAEIDALMGLVEELAEFLRTKRQFGDAVWVRTENSPVYSQEHLGELRQFTSVLTATLRVVKT